MSQSQQSTSFEFPPFDILFHLCRSCHLQSYVLFVSIFLSGAINCPSCPIDFFSYD